MKPARFTAALLFCVLCASIPHADGQQEGNPRSEDRPQRPGATSQNAVPNLEQGFRRLDADRNGTLSLTEFEVLRERGVYFRENPTHLEPVFEKLDKDKNGVLSLDEFRGIIELRRSAAGQIGTAAPPAKKETSPVTPPAPKAARASPPAAASASDLAFFEKHIRPVLIKRCYECHSSEAKELKSGLSLDSRAALLKGGDSGLAVVPGQPGESLLISSLRHDHPDLKMPPEKSGGKLEDLVIANFVEWVKRGVPMPEGTSRATTEAMEVRLSHWAFQPVQDPPAPAVKDTRWPRTEVDRFVLAALEKKGLSPVADAAPAALLRRIHLDLTGLPPTEAEVAAFVSNSDKDGIESVVRRLLDSPHFGERWGRHWLDVSRYAESSGKETDFAYPHAWRYRDYVIHSFNTDKPFDQFVCEQIAGDLDKADDPKLQTERLIATGFLAIGPKSHGERNPLQFEMDVVDEQIEAVGQAFLGLTVACARCHDHKHDPVSQRDYYALAGVFRSTDTRYGTIRLLQNNNPSALVPIPKDAQQPDALKPLSPENRTFLENSVKRGQASVNELVEKREFASPEFVRTRLRLEVDRARLAAFDADGTPKQFATCVREHETPCDSTLFIRGEVQKPGAAIPRGLPMFAKGGAVVAQGSGRRELAAWISSADNPLTPRVLVNRVWLHLFGQGIVATPDNFGLSGEAPTHPELLEHLAARFVREGWSVKKLIAHLMGSHVYALATTHNPANIETDPDNTLLWRMTPRRLDAESIRDAMLLTAGKLDLKPPTGSAVGANGDGYVASLMPRTGGAPDQLLRCRSVYLPVMRNLPLESLALFDMAAGSSVTGQRAQTAVPAQSLYLLNSDYVKTIAEAAAKRLCDDRPTSDPDRITLAYERIFNRPPTGPETQAALRFVQSKPDPAKRWAALCQSMWASYEFLSRP
jgi:hypothetical protein